MDIRLIYIHMYTILQNTKVYDKKGTLNSTVFPYDKIHNILTPHTIVLAYGLNNHKIPYTKTCIMQDKMSVIGAIELVLCY